MKKTLIALSVALLLSTSASAVTTSDIVARQKYCGEQGHISVLRYTLEQNYKIVGRANPRTKQSEMAVEDKQLEDSTAKEINLRAIAYVYDKATSAEDAYIGVWALCMDLLSAGDQYAR